MDIEHLLMKGVIEKGDEITRLRAEVERLTLKPNERVIDVERVRELVRDIENRYLGINEIDRWEELRKELGIE